MLRVFSAEGTILAALKLFGSILLVLDRVVIPLLALGTSQSDLDSVISHTFRHLLFYLSALRCGHLPPCIGHRHFSRKIAHEKRPLVRQVIVNIPYPGREVKSFFLKNTESIE